MWLDSDQCLGIESSSFFLGERGTNFNSSLHGKRRFWALTVHQRSHQLDSPAAGSAFGARCLSRRRGRPSVNRVHTTSQLYGTELNLRSNLWRNCCWRIDVIGGFRYVNLNESLDVRENLDEAAGMFNPGGPVMVHDSFQTTNNFYGGQLGLDMGFKRGRWSLDVHWQNRLGRYERKRSHHRPGPRRFQVSAWRLPVASWPCSSNMGTFDRNRLAFIPEGGLKLGFQATQHCRLFVGYSYMYLSDVVRPGDQIDPRVDLRQVPIASFLTGGVPVPGMLMPPASFPSVLMKRSDFWAQWS